MGRAFHFLEGKQKDSELACDTSSSSHEVLKLLLVDGHRYHCVCAVENGGLELLAQQARQNRM